MNEALRAQTSFILTRLEILRRLVESAQYRLGHSNPIDRQTGRNLLLSAASTSQDITNDLRDIVEREGKNAVSSAEAE